jgi:uncharacterized SAM-binding protein YcdF (DUF218 family)
MQWIRRIAVAFTLLWLVITFSPVVDWWTMVLAGRWESEKGDVLIIPGYETMGDGLLGYGSYLRSFYAVRAWRKHPYRRIIISGKEVAPEMAAYLRTHGVPAERISIDNLSTTTRENATYSKALLTPEDLNIVLMTSDFHARRAAAAYRKAGVPVASAPVAHFLKLSASSRWNRFALLPELALESLKHAGYWWRGWI